MTKSPPEGTGRKASLGRRLLLLLILAVLLIAALVWMSVYLFDPNAALDLDDLGIFAIDFNRIYAFLALVP